MIRPLTLITMLLAAVSGAYLFAVKHRAQMLDEQIANISQASRLDAQRIRVLQAQWALETDPTRLQQLAAQFTDLQPMQPAQLITLAALRSSLPAPGSAPPDGNPELPDQALPEFNTSPSLPDAALQAAAQNTILIGGMPLPPPPQIAPPLAMASDDIALTAPAAAMAGPVRRVSHSVLSSSELAQALPPTRPYVAPHVFTVAAAALPAAYREPVVAPAVAVKATRYVPPTPPIAADDSGSVLGMAANLPPPQPLQAGLNN